MRARHGLHTVETSDVSSALPLPMSEIRTPIHQTTINRRESLCERGVKTIATFVGEGGWTNQIIYGWGAVARLNVDLGCCLLRGGASTTEEFINGGEKARE